jgi:hypothetical protein
MPADGKANERAKRRKIYGEVEDGRRAQEEEK